MSCVGFQLASNTITRFAATRLIPSDPAFVEIRNKRTLKFHRYYVQHANNKTSSALSLSFNGHFPGEPGLANVY